MHDDGSAATAMLGLDGFVLLAVSQYAGELEQAVETTAAEDFCRSSGCRPGCMTGARRGCGICQRAGGR